MALQTLNTIKNWFKTGLKPTQTQFWDTWDSFRHKYDKVPVKDVDGLDELLLSKADKTILDNHLTDSQAHTELIKDKLDKGGYSGTGQDLANAIPDLNAPNLKLGGYPNTRNDGQLPTNKVLGTDENGNLKMYTIATAPAPYLDELIPDSHLPNSTGNFILKGAFFTPTMTVEIQNQTVNYIRFKSDNEIHVNVTTSSAEGSFAVTLNNGLSATFPNTLMIVLGEVFEPTSSDWVNMSGNLNVEEKGAAKVVVYNTYASAVWNKTINWTKDFSIRFNVIKTPLGYPYGYYQRVFLGLISESSNALLFGFTITPENTDRWYGAMPYGWENIIRYGLGDGQESFDRLAQDNIEIRWLAGTFSIYKNNSFLRAIPNLPTENLRLYTTVVDFDVINIKYIELAT